MEELETKKCTECGTELMHNGKSVLCKRCYTKIWARNKKKAKVSVEEATNQLFKPTEDFIPISEISKHSKPDCSITLTLSFPDKCKHIFDLIKSDADDQLRTVEHQVIWVLKKYYETELGDG